MNRFKGKTSIAVLAMIASLSLTTLAAVPNGTVVMGDKAYDLEYVEKTENYLEVAKQFIKNGDQTYLKTEDGKWFDLKTNKEIKDKGMIPQLIYKNAEGKIMEYLAEDGDEFKLNIAKASFVSKDKVVIQFNKEIDAKLAADKANYKIGGKALIEADKVEVSEDNKSVTITLNPIAEDKNFETNITISNKLTDKYGVKMDNSYSKNVLVVNKESTVKNFKGDVCIIAEGAEYKDSEVEGNIYVNADKVDVKGIKKVNNIFVNPGEKGSADIENLDAKGIVVLSGAKESVHLNKVNVDNLMISTKGSTRVELNEGSAVKNTVVSGDTILDAEDGSFGDVDILNDTQSKEQPTIVLEGNFKGTITVKGNTKIVAAEGAVIENLVIETESEEDNVTLEGTFKNVTIKSEAKVVLGETAQVKNLKAGEGVDAKVEMKKGAKVEKTEVETTGPGKENIGETVSTGGGNFSGGNGAVNPSKPTIKKSAIEKAVQNTAEKVETEFNKNFKEYGSITASGNKMTIKISDAMKEKDYNLYDLLVELNNKPGKKDILEAVYYSINDKIDVKADNANSIEEVIFNLTGTKNVEELKAKYKDMSYDQLVEEIKNIDVNGSFEYIKVCEKFLNKVYMVQKDGNFNFYDRNDKTPVATLDELRKNFTNFKNAKVSNLTGTYKVEFSGYTYTIVIE